MTANKNSRSNKMVRMNVTMNVETATILDQLAEASASSKSDVLRKSLTLYLHAHEAKLRGQQVYLGRDGKIETNIIGI